MDLKTSTAERKNSVNENSLLEHDQLSCRRTISFETGSSSDGGTKDQRTVGYCMQEAKDPRHRNSAIFWFYPLSGASVVVEYAAASFAKYKASVICVDRPGIGDTDQHLPSSKQRSSLSMDRIEQHAQDVLEVLKHHKEIQFVYLMGVCLGHAYAIQVARRLLHLQQQQEESRSGGSPPVLKGMTLVAPFVSTACPYAWGVARFGGHYVPSWILSAATSAMTAAGDMILSSLLTPTRVQSLIGETQQKEFGWTENDFEHLCQVIKQVNRWNGHQTKSIEANLGADPSWQQIVDDFALESGCGLNTDEDDCSKDAEKKSSSSLPPPAFPVRIRATEKDKVAPYASVQWVARRNYGGITIQMETHRIPSHEGMTFLGGPPRNPSLLHEIAQEWGLVELT